jgi:hypothetical protein
MWSRGDTSAKRDNDGIESAEEGRQRLAGSLG